MDRHDEPLNIFQIRSLLKIENFNSYCFYHFIRLFNFINLWNSNFSVIYQKNYYSTYRVDLLMTHLTARTKTMQWSRSFEYKYENKS